MDPSGKRTTQEDNIKLANDRTNYEIRRNIVLAIVLYFGRSMLRMRVNGKLRLSGIPFPRASD